MLSTRYAAPLRLEVHPSLQLLIFLVTAHGGALGITLFLPIPWPARLMVMLLLLVSLLWNNSRHFLLSAQGAITELVWLESGDWIVHLAGGGEYKALLLADSYLSSRLVILNFGISDGKPRRSVILCEDTLDEMSFRRLCVRLRTEGNSFRE